MTLMLVLLLNAIRKVIMPKILTHCYVADISTLLVKINIPEGQIGLVQIGSVADIEMPKMPGEKFQN